MVHQMTASASFANLLWSLFLTRSSYSYAVGVYGTSCRVSVLPSVKNVLWLNGARGPRLLLTT